MEPSALKVTAQGIFVGFTVVIVIEFFRLDLYHNYIYRKFFWLLFERTWRWILFALCSLSISICTHIYRVLLDVCFSPYVLVWLFVH